MGIYGNVTGEILENGADTTRVYNTQTGRIESILTQSNNILVQNLEYDWDVAGNLIERRDTGWMSQTSWKSLTEHFYYDGLNRLTSNKINGVTEMSMSYNAIGNIQSKTGIDSTKNFGTYNYGATCNGVQAGPHAVTSAGSRSYCYDQNGNMLSGDGRTLAYTTFDKPSSITKSGHTTGFSYGTSHNRYKRVDTEGSLVITKHYVGNVEIITNSGTGKTSYKRYIGGSTIKTQVINGNTTTEYAHKDHLGSLDAITRTDGSLKADVSFDAFGVRRNSVAWATLGLLPTADLELITDTTERGFTNHEMLDDVDVIHMNGRIYDGRLGRFLQADPHIQEPNNAQSLNRYSYVINNPLSYTDPTGYNFLKKYWRAIVAIVVTYFTAGAASGWAASWGFGSFGSGVIAGAIGGAAGGFVATGTLKGAVIGAFTGAAFGALHGWQPDGFSMGKIAAHGGVGGISSVLSGGKFGHGFVAAGFTQAASQAGGDSLFSKTDKAGNAVKAALIGGTASAISGGKFANGAITGAFSRMLNDDVFTPKKKRDVTIKFKYKSVGLDKFKRAIEKYDVEGLYQDRFEPGTYEIEVSLDTTLPKGTPMRTPDVYTIKVNPTWLNNDNTSIGLVGSVIGHEVFHVSDRWAGKTRNLETRAYNWQLNESRIKFFDLTKSEVNFIRDSARRNMGK